MALEVGAAKRGLLGRMPRDDRSAGAGNNKPAEVVGLQRAKLGGGA
jgi:hypothetical protein